MEFCSCLRVFLGAITTPRSKSNFTLSSDTTWRAPKFLVEPTWGSNYVECEKGWNLEPLPTSSIRGGERGMLEVSG
jgi:hypothetical protein